MRGSSEKTVVAFRGRDGNAAPLRLAALVETMQAAAYKDAPWLLRQLDPANAAVVAADLQRKYDGRGMDFARAEDDILRPSDDFPMAKSSSSPLQDPYAYGAVRKLWIEVDRLSTRHGDRLERQPLLGTLPTGLINARALRLPTNGETAILFDDEIRVLAHMIAKVVACVITVPDGDGPNSVDIDLNRAQDPERHAPDAVRWFAATVDSYMRDGWIRILPVWMIPPAAHRLALILCDAFEMFVMGHEYGHLARAHHEGAVHQVIREEGVTEAAMQRSQEIEADAYGLRTACDATMEEFGTPIIGFWGAYIAAKGFELLDRALYCVAKRSDWLPWENAVLRWLNEQSSHPPSAIRAAIFVDMMSHGPFKAQAIEFAAAMDTLFANLFPAARDALLARSSVNKGIHPRFNGRVAHFMLSAPGPSPAAL